jgi:hypothetical protein
MKEIKSFEFGYINDNNALNEAKMFSENRNSGIFHQRKETIDQNVLALTNKSFLYIRS